MKYKVPILATLIVAVLTGFFVIGNKPSKSSVTSDSTPNVTTQPQVDAPQEAKETVLSGNVEVIYEDSGFTPSSVTIARGTTINFTNKTQIPLWVASDPHPEHTNYPGFDMAEKGSVPEPGENASFTFDKQGTWTYHNHSAPEDKATVIVK